ncbi:MAG: hypothetical protein ACOYMB_05175 [Patescibacteria group bacterium]
MKTHKIYIFGNAFSVPDNKVVGFIVDIESNGTIKQNYGSQKFFLKISVVIEKAVIFKKMILLATAGYEGTLREKLFYKIIENAFDEKNKKIISDDLLNQFLKGNISEQGLAEKVEKLILA